MVSLTAIPALADDGAAPPEENAAATGLWQRDTLTGDWGGLRKQLEDAGLKLSGVYTGEALGNPSGGIKQRGVAEGLLEVDVDADLNALVGWQGATFHASTFQIHGRGLSSNFVGNLFTVRDIEAAPSTRLWAMWLQQNFADGLVSLRVGQMPEQEEFVVSSYGATFINGTFGWPIGLAANMPNGGGAYPLAMTGARLRIQPTESFGAMVAVFDGDPAPGNPPGGDPVRWNHHGFNFRVNDPAAIFTELNYGLNQGKDAEGLPTMFKLGGWIHTARFNDLHYDNNGVSLASPASDGTPRSYRGNAGIYGIVDQMLWRAPGTEDGGIGAFTRVMGEPADRNQMPFYAELGLTWKGMLPAREDDVAGVAFAYGSMSPDLAARDEDARNFGTAASPTHDYESVVELIYRAKVAPWWTVIPDVQNVVHPGGGAGLPDDPASRIPNAWILGLRTVFNL